MSKSYLVLEKSVDEGTLYQRTNGGRAIVTMIAQFSRAANTLVWTFSRFPVGVHTVVAHDALDACRRYLKQIGIHDDEIDIVPYDISK